MLVSRRWYAELAASAVGDQGGRAFFAARTADTVFVDYPDPISDIDTEQDLATAERQLAEHAAERQLAEDAAERQLASYTAERQLASDIAERQLGGQ